MSWLTNFVRPKIRALVRKTDVPENLWDKCPGCGQMIFHRDLEANLRVCPQCGHHMRIEVKKRLELLFDGGAFERAELPRVEFDPLKFRDRKRYSDRLKEAQSKTEEQDAIIVAHGLVGGLKMVVAAFNFDFMGGSMGAAVGEGMVAASDLAVKERAALIAIPASGGARMQEGILSLMQMPRTVIAVDRVKEAGLPFVVLLTDARVIEETIREKLPEGFQRAEYLLDHGIVDLVVARKDLPKELSKIIGLLTKQPKQAAA
jgi:acetyl-CoA carboxylase carboxyl transferase subunit beta